MPGRQQVKYYAIEQTTSGATVWDGPAESEADALERWAKDAGYESYADMCERAPLGADTIEVSEVEAIA